MEVAVSPARRRRGLRPIPAGRALLLRGSAVHSFGMEEPLRVVGIGRDGRVRRVGLLMPNRVVVIPEAAWVLETSPTEPAPPAGARLTLVREIG